MFELLNFKQLKEFILYGFIISVVGTVVVLNTGFVDEITKRAKERNLEDRDLEGEARYLEYGLIYKDLFVYYEYSPWFGYGPFESGGNYGKGIFGERVLHTEFAHYVHASGFLGLTLYILMVSLAFLSIWRKKLTREDKFQFFFLLFYFSAHFLLGWSRNLIPAVMFFSILNLPMARINSRNIGNTKVSKEILVIK
jgi:O-antigen ligase